MRYDAFISYRHADLDLYIAKSLHKGLETFKVPRAVAEKSGKKNIKRVFRDQEELPIGSDLGNNIEAALAESEYLIVICSPRTPESYWVQKEISTFIEMHGREHVLAVLIEGEPEQSFPRALLEDENGNPVEPLAADVRGATKRECNRKMKTEIMRLAAPLLKCSYDDLRQRHKERRMRRAIAGCAAVAVGAVLFGAYSVYNTFLIQQNLQGKQRNQSKYLADTSLKLLAEGDRRAAVLVALEALPSAENDRPFVAEAQYALSSALYCYDAGMEIGMDMALKHDLPVREFALDEDGGKILSIDQGDRVYVWDVETGTRLARILPRVGEDGFVEILEGAMVYGEHIILCEENMLRSVDFAGQEEWRIESPSYMLGCKFEKQQGVIACAGSDEVIFYDVLSGEKIAKMRNEQEVSYTFDMTFSEDGSQFAIAHYVDEDVPQGLVSIYDFKTEEMTVASVTGAYVVELAFASDGGLIVASCDYDSSVEGFFGETGYVDKIDRESQSIVWSNTFEYPDMGMEGTSVGIKCREYEDATGERHAEVLLSANNKAYAWDSGSGEQISEIVVDSGIVSQIVSTQTGLSYLCGTNGNIDIVDMTQNERYLSNTIYTGQNLRDVQIKNGVMILRAYASPTITLMKYHEGTGMERLDSFENYVMGIEYSEEETYYSVVTYSSGAGEHISFYRTDDNSFISEWVPFEEGNSRDAGFMDDSHYMVACANGEILYYNVETGETDDFETGEWSYAYCDRAENSFIAVMYDNMRYCIVDLKKREIISEGDMDVRIHGGIPSEDGKHIYCSVPDMGVCDFDTETGKTTPFGEEYRVLRNGEVKNALALSADGKFLAVGCQDGLLRVCDLDTTETVSEIPFAGVNRKFIEFTRNDTQLMMQGDDYYFRVYDLQKKEFAHISTEQYYEIGRAVFDRETDTISLVTTVDMVILNGADYERAAQIDHGMAYSPKYAKILCAKWGNMYRFTYMTPEMLREEAKTQFGEETLSKEERIRYHVD